MMLLFLSALALLHGLSEVRPLGAWVLSLHRGTRGLQDLRRSAARLRLLEEMLECGVSPEPADWETLRHFPEPWGDLILKSVQELRSEGAPLLPTLKRMRRTLQEQVDFHLDARVKSAQALSQAWMALFTVPVFALLLYSLLPGVQETSGPFFLAVLAAEGLSCAAFVWIHLLAEHARFGNVRAENRRWWISIHAASERIMALIASGTPPDLSWQGALGELLQSEGALARVWGMQVWDPFEPHLGEFKGECERLMVHLGSEMRRSIQTSLLEGRGCLERLDSIHQSFTAELRMRVQWELSLLPHQCLKPLFILVFPAVLILLFSGLWLSLPEWGMG